MTHKKEILKWKTWKNSGGENKERYWRENQGGILDLL
jgi:hypothetical protein